MIPLFSWTTNVDGNWVHMQCEPSLLSPPVLIFQLFHYLPIPSTPLYTCCSQPAAALRQADEGPSQRALWERDGVLLQPAAGLHQRAHAGRQHPGHVAAPQLGQALHPPGVRSRAAAEPLEHAEEPPQGGEAQCRQAQSQWEWEWEWSWGSGVDVNLMWVFFY